MSEPIDPKRYAKLIASNIFMDGHGSKITRLKAEYGNVAVTGTGYCEGAIADYIEEAITTVLKSHQPEADHAKQLAEREEALAVAVNAMADLSGLVECKEWCPASKVTRATNTHVSERCTCGNERDHQAIIDAANKNPLVASAVAKVKGTEK